MNPMDTPEYKQSYALHYPRYSAMWSRKHAWQCRYAQEDIHTALRLMPDADPAYLGKLYAELDAVRDRMMILRKGDAA